MWKVCRKTVFPRWHTRKQNDPKKNTLKPELIQSTGSHTAADNGRKPGSEDYERQHAHKHQRAFWEDPQYHYAINPNWLETIGLIGTAFVVGLNVQYRHLKNCYSSDGRLYVCNGQRACRQICADVTSLFTKYAWAMPKTFHNKALPKKTSVSEFVSNKTASSQSENSTNEKVESIDASLKEMKQITDNYIAEADYNLGLKLLNSDAFQAFKFFKSAAQLGHAKALFNLGLCYESGKGTKVDLKKAAEYYVQASLQGHCYALYNVGVYHIQGIGGIPKNEVVGLQFLKKAAAQGVLEAQVYLGLQYLEEEKWSDAFKMFSDSVKQDSVEGKYYLGVCYENGWGVAQNENIAVEMYISAAFKGHEDATFSLGQCYENGRGGLTKNDQLAMALYQIIADKGHLDALNAVNILKNKSHSTLKPTSDDPILSCKKYLHSERVISSPKIGLHESASSPELMNYDSYILSESSKYKASPHLDIVVPFTPSGEICSYNKPLLCSNFGQSVFSTLSLMNWSGRSIVSAART